MKAIASVLALFAVIALESEARDRAQRDLFVASHPCPANGKPRGPCPGWVVDHIMPLCAGGIDRPENMQWQTVADAKAKDRDEVRACRAARARANGAIAGQATAQPCSPNKAP